MSIKKFKLGLMQIVDEMGDLKPLGYYYTDYIPRKDEQIAVLMSDEDGKPIKRLYFVVENVVHFSSAGDTGVVSQNDDVIGEIQVKLLIDEPPINF